MTNGLMDEPNPLYFIVVLASSLWAASLVFPPVIEHPDLVYVFNLGVFAVWAVLPVAMAFDVAIVRQKFAMPARMCIPLIVLSAIPVVAPLAGGIYVWYRSRVVAPSSE